MSWKFATTPLRLRKVPNHARACVSAWAQSREGNTSMLFAVAALPVFMVIGAGVDLNNGFRHRERLAQAVDAVALATAQKVAVGVSGSALETYASTTLASAANDDGVTMSGAPSVNSTTGEVCVTANKNVPTTIMQIAQINAMAVSVTACAQVAAASYEIALVLDTTGSMANADSSGQSKLTSMKTAAKSFIDTMFDSQTLGPRTKMSVVPFAPSVNVGAAYANASWMDTSAQSSWHWKGPAFAADSSVAANRFALFNVLSAQRSAWAWGGCVESLPYPLNVSDSAPSASNPDSYFLPMFAPDEPADVVETYYDNRGRLRSQTTQTYDNSYIGDKGACSTAAPTDASTSSQTTSQSRLCKYRSATNMVTSSGWGPNAFCNSAPLVRLQTTKTALKTTVDSLAASGSTNIHEGFMWGWRTVSPNAPFADGRAYADKNNVKVIVLMTDGMNTWYDMNNALNGSAYSAYGYYNSANGRLPPSNQNLTTGAQARNAMDQLVRTACANARAQGVIIYTIAFSVPTDPIDAQGIQLLKDCAGDTSRYFAPDSQSTLSKAFADIGASVGKLRLSR